MCLITILWYGSVRQCLVSLVGYLAFGKFFFILVAPPSLEWFVFHQLVLIRCPKVRSAATVIMTEICGTAQASYVVLFLFVVPVDFSCDKGALGPHVPVVEGVTREVVVFPTAKDIIGDGVEIVSTMLVTIIVVIVAGKASKAMIGWTSIFHRRSCIIAVIRR